MIRSSSVAKGTLFAFLLLGSYACGDSKPPPKPPENPTSAADGGDTSTASTDTHSDAGATASTDKPPTTDTPPPAPAKLELPSAAAKYKVKGKTAFDIELKSDGTVNNAGKAWAKISGMELQDKDGKTQLKVDNDGNITTGEGAAYAKFEGDDLASLTGVKFSAGDEITQTDDKGKKTSLGKAEGIGGAKKAALLTVAFALWGTKAPAPKAAPPDKKAPDKPAGGDKKAPDKPAGGDKKAPDKPAPKK